MPWVLAPALMEGLPILLGGILLLGLAETAKVWLEPTISTTRTRKGGLFARIADIPSVLLRAAAASAFAVVAHSISVGASHRMRSLARWLNGGGAWLLAIFFGVGLFAAEVAHGFERTTTVVIPREIGRATRPISRRAKQAWAAAAAAAAATAALRRWAHRTVTHEIRPAIRHAAHAIDVAIPREFGRIRTRVRDLERDFTHPSTRWLRRIAAAMFAGTILGLMIRTLARRFPWLFCRKVRNVGQRVCGLDSDLLNSLILDTLVIGGTVSIVQFARDLQAIEGVTVDAIRGFIDEV